MMKTLFVIFGFLTSFAFAEDMRVAREMTIEGLSSAHQQQVCLGKTFVAHVVGIDAPYSGVMEGSVLPPNRGRSPVNLMHVVDIQTKMMKQIMGETECEEVIRQAMKAGQPAPEVVLFILVDGEQNGDTEIQTIRYVANESGKMVAEPVVNWTVGSVKNSFVPSGEVTAAFELHLPTQLESTIRFFKNELSDTPFDQVIYLIKAHGMPFTSKDFEDDLLVEMTQEFPKQVSLNHAFMFDANGPDPKADYSSDLRHPYWMPFDGCRALSVDKRITPELLRDHPGLCSCLNVLSETDRPIGNFEACKSAVVGTETDLFDPPFMGGAKSTLVRNFAEFSGRPVSTNVPTGARIMASAITYDMTAPNVRGMQTLQLPVASQPTLILFDSCKSTPEVYKILEPSKTKAKTTIVTLSSDNLVSDNVTNYSVMNLTDYRLLASATAWYSNETDGEDRERVVDMVLGVNSYFNHSGLEDLKWVAEEIDKVRENGEEPNLRELIADSRYNDNRYRFFRLEMH